MKNFKWGGFLLFTALLLFGCNSKGCYESMNVRLKANFYLADTSAMVAVSVDSISVWGVGVDSALYKNSTAGSLKLILNPTSDTTQYVVRAIQNGHAFYDTITFIHSNQLKFESLECGSMVFSNLKSCSVKGVLFKSASITDSLVQNIDTEHVRLYL